MPCIPQSNAGGITYSVSNKSPAAIAFRGFGWPGRLILDRIFTDLAVSWIHKCRRLILRKPHIWHVHKGFLSRPTAVTSSSATRRALIGRPFFAETCCNGANQKPGVLDINVTQGVDDVFVRGIGTAMIIRTWR